MLRLVRVFAVPLALTMGLAADSAAGIQKALAELRRGDFASAEKTLEAEVQARPDDAGALTLLGVALDNQKKFREAAEMHRRAAASAPNSADVWNNYANHDLGTGDEEGARKHYLQAVALEPAHFNANVQLARLAVKKKAGGEALEYLRHLLPAQQDVPQLAPLRAEALYLADETAEADRLTAHFLAEAKGDLAASFAMGVALADAGKLEAAETFFTQALAVAPADFSVLFNLGVVEWHAGNYARAREVLEAAERQQPENVELLYTLAAVDHASKRTEEAVVLLARAERLAPRRSDVQKLLALATGDLGALADSAAAWERYLKLDPKDDVGRRERGFTAFRMGNFDEALADLRWFVARHPDDPVGHFELATAENIDNPAQALPEFDRAIQLKPDFAVARSARGNVYYQMGRPEEALADEEAAAKLRPDDAVNLDRLGQTYQALDRAADAVRVLRQAAVLAPNDSKTQFHLARALADAGQAEESKTAMERFRQLGPADKKGVPGGLVDYLNLTPEARRADYRKRVERVVHEHPDDTSAQLSYLRLELEDGKTAQAVETGGRIAALKPAAPILADAGRALLEGRQYAAARALLEQAASAGSTPGMRLDLARAAFREAGPAEGLRLLDGIGPDDRGGEYFLARAEMLEAAGSTADAGDALDQAFRSAPGQPDLYRRVGIFLLRGKRTGDALRISEKASQAFPRDREILLLRGVALEAAGRTEEAESLLRQVQSRWPEWAAAWTAEGVILGMHGKREEAGAALRTAQLLGAGGAEVKGYLEELAAGREGRPPDLIAILEARE